MTPEELQTIRKATEEATKGSWYASDYYNEIVPIMDDNGTIRRREDSAFIANARAWVPQLLEYIEELEFRLMLDARQIAGKAFASAERTQLLNTIEELQQALLDTHDDLGCENAGDLCHAIQAFLAPEHL